MLDFQTERLSKETLPELYAMYLRVFKNRDIPYWKIKALFNTGEYGWPEYIGYFAKHQGKYIGYYGVLPVELHGVLSGQSCFTMIDANYRGRGIFERLTDETYSLAADSGLRYIWGAPNDLSRPTFIRRGWRHLYDMVKYEWYVPTIPLSRLYKRLPGKYVESSDVYINYKQRCGARFIYDSNLVSVNYGMLKIGNLSSVYINGLKRFCMIRGIYKIQEIVPAIFSRPENPDKISKTLPLMYFPLYEKPTIYFTGLDYDTF